MALQDELKTFAQAMCGVDMFGVADLTPAREFIKDQSKGLLPSLPRAVSIGIALPAAVVDTPPKEISEPCG